MKRKWLVQTFTALALCVVLTGCTSNRSKTSVIETRLNTEDEKHILVAYFSWSGNTKDMARTDCRFNWW